MYVSSSAVMDEIQVSPTLARSPIVDSADFCRPLAKISGVSLEIQPDRDAELSVIMANDLRLQQVSLDSYPP